MHLEFKLKLLKVYQDAQLSHIRESWAVFNYDLVDLKPEADGRIRLNSFKKIRSPSMLLSALRKLSLKSQKMLILKQNKKCEQMSGASISPSINQKFACILCSIRNY